jgi:hypothetical protein
MGSTLDIITSWDPMSFMSHAPSDEYSNEAKLIDEILASTQDVNVVARGIEEIFRTMFEDDFTKSHQECILVAIKLISK